MAKISGPLLSLGGSGAVAQALIFQNWKGIKTVKQFTVPFDPKSAAQEAWRGAIRTVSEYWSWFAFTPIDKIAYQLGSTVLGRPMSAYNFFLYLAMRVNIPGLVTVFMNWFEVVTNDSGEIAFMFGDWLGGGPMYQWGYSISDFSLGQAWSTPIGEGFYYGTLTGLTPGRTVYVSFRGPLGTHTAGSPIYKIKVL